MVLLSAISSASYLDVSISILLKNHNIIQILRATPTDHLAGVDWFHHFWTIQPFQLLLDILLSPLKKYLKNLVRSVLDQHGMGKQFEALAQARCDNHTKAVGDGYVLYQKF